MYEDPFHDQDISESTFLITGGAGFIGSNIVEYLIKHKAGKVLVLDNLSEGKKENIEPFIGLRNFEFIEGDITNESTCQQVCEGVDYISHQAALGSVPRSINTPTVTNAANVTGFLNMLTAAKDAEAKRFVYASSSSVYGDSKVLPKVEQQIGKPLSPYAVSKYVNEVYAGVFALTYGIEVVGLRYFNVFGPRQKPDGPYAAVIPLFMDALLNNRPPTIHGDGDQTRDFTFVANAVEANIRGMFSQIPDATNKVYNIAYGERASVNELFSSLRGMTNSNLEPNHVDPRPGDVRDSLANISQAKELLGYNPKFDMDKGLAITFDWFKSRFG